MSDLRRNRLRNAGLVLMTAAAVLFPTATPHVEAMSMDDLTSWKQLPEGTKKQKFAGDGLHYFEFKTKNGSNAFLLVVDLITDEVSLRPVVNKSTATTTATTQRNNALASVNGAFFNLTNGESTSYVTVSGELVCDPRKNKALVDNPHLKPFLDAIYNRSELRFVKSRSGKIQICIAPHNISVAHDTKILHAIQAGPRLLPTLTDKLEAFVRTEPDGKVVDSIGVYKPAARTAVGITEGGREALLLCIASKRQDEFSEGLTLPELAQLLKRLGCVEALNLDGGTSTTMSICSDTGGNLPDQKAKMVCGRVPETLVKTTLSIFRANK